MNTIDFVEIWCLSMRELFEAAGVTAHFERSPLDRPNPSCNLNLRRNEHEADLMVWESGAAEFVVGEVGGSIDQKHFDDIRNQQDLVTVLSMLAAMASVTQSK